MTTSKIPRVIASALFVLAPLVLAACASSPVAVEVEPVPAPNVEIQGATQGAPETVSSVRTTTAVSVSMTEAKGLAQYGVIFTVVVLNGSVEGLVFGPKNISAVEDGNSKLHITDIKKIWEVESDAEFNARMFAMLGASVANAANMRASSTQSLRAASLAQSAEQLSIALKAASKSSGVLASQYQGVGLLDDWVEPLETHGGFVAVTNYTGRARLRLVVKVGNETHEFTFKAKAAS